jgi:hypothetical protein
MENKMSLIKLAGKLPPQVAAIFHDLVKGGMKPGHAAAKAWGEVRRSGVEITPAMKTVAKVAKKADNGIQGSLFNSEEFTQTWKRIKK